MKSQIKSLAEIITGFLFGMGLIISGMNNPNKVQGFLDITGLWDPSLIFVISGAIGIAIIPFYLANKYSKSWLRDSIYLPNKTLIDKKLLIGNAIFGIGWGLAGICPGPAIVNLASSLPKAILFIMAMLLGMKVAQFAPKLINNASQSEPWSLIK